MNAAKTKTGYKTKTERVCHMQISITDHILLMIHCSMLLQYHSKAYFISCFRISNLTQLGTLHTRTWLTHQYILTQTDGNIDMLLAYMVTFPFIITFPYMVTHDNELEVLPIMVTCVTTIYGNITF